MNRTRTAPVTGEVLVLADPVARGQGLEQGTIEAAGRAQVDVLVQRRPGGAWRPAVVATGGGSSRDRRLAIDQAGRASRRQRQFRGLATRCSPSSTRASAMADEARSYAAMARRRSDADQHGSSPQPVVAGADGCSRTCHQHRASIGGGANRLLATVASAMRATVAARSAVLDLVALGPVLQAASTMLGQAAERTDEADDRANWPSGTAPMDHPPCLCARWTPWSGLKPCSG